MIEADVTANKNNRKLKDDSAFLLNDVEITFYDKTIKTQKNRNMNKLSVNVRNGAV